ncbi:MAG TPA: hypothetical protein DDW54_03965, partial [Clostridiales bacterium]|nr:hypothetical protein [Clostridiales bacterium]
MKKATHKILMAAASLVIALGVASGTTFAWFTANRTVSIGTINATVTTGTEGLYVAIKNYAGTEFSTFEETLSGDDLNTAIFGGTASANLATVKLDALTSLANTNNTGENSNGLTLKDHNGVETTYNREAATTEGKNKFIEFTLKFKTTTPMNIYLSNKNAANSKQSQIATNGAGVVSNFVLAWDDTVSASNYGKDPTDGKIDARAANAARVAFITHANTEGTKTWTADTTGASGQVWAPNEAVDDSNTGEKGKGFWKGNVAEDYNYHFRNNANPATRAVASTVVNQVTTIDLDDITNSEGSATVIATTAEDTNREYVAIVTVRLWIEGTDGDC